MEVVKKFGLWILSAILIIGAVVFYILVVRNLVADRAERMKAVETNKGQLEKLAKDANAKAIPNPKWIEEQRKSTEQLNRQSEGAELYLANQPRECHTRWFYDNELWGPTEEIRAQYAWLQTYDRRNEELMMQLADAGMLAFRVETLNQLWGNFLPQEGQSNAAMEYYWFQKDFADILTGQVVKDLDRLILYLRESPTSFPAKASDLVINRAPKRLDEFLRALPEEDLRAVLTAILINKEQMDLAMIFNTLLPEKFPWSRPPDEQDKVSVQALTMDDEQRAFLERIVPTGKPDLRNNQRYLIYLRDLRTVRYRSDVIRMLENHGFQIEAERLRKGTAEEYARLLNDINNTPWSRTKMAQAIAAIVSIKDEKDYELLKNNHKPEIQQLVSLQISMPLTVNGMSLGGYQEEPHPNIYTTVNVTMTVIIDFDRIPVFVRSLLNNSWIPDVKITRVAPIVAKTVGGANAPVAASSEALNVGNQVAVDLLIEAHHFKPLLPKLKEHMAAAAAAGTTETQE